MIISYYGHSCFKIQSIPRRGEGDVTIFTDPFDKSVGLRPPQGSANIVTVSHLHQDHANFGALKGEPFLIDAPGEYSVKNIVIQGLDSFHDNVQGAQRGRNTIFIFESEELRICHLGDLGHTLDEDLVEKIGEVDVLMVPIGGTYTLDAKAAKEVVSQIEPAIIIPMHYKLPGTTISIDDEKNFCKLFGTDVDKKESRLNLKKKDIEELENHLILMETSGN